MKIMNQKWTIYLISTVLIFVAGCATTGEGNKAVQSSQLPVITAINIADNQIVINADKQFTYTIYKATDPYKVIAELPNVRLGIKPEKIKSSDKAGITEVSPSQTEEPILTKIEILLASPSAVESSYKDNILIIKVKEPDTKTAEITKPEDKEIKKEEPVPVKEETVAETQKPAYNRDAVKEFPSATSITDLNIEKVENILKVKIKGNGALSPNVFRLDNRAVLDIPGVEMIASVPAKVPAPLKSIRVGKYKDKTRLVIDMIKDTQFDVAAVEDYVMISFHVEDKAADEQVVSKAEAPAVEKKTVTKTDEIIPEGKYKGQKISLDFQDADIGPIFRLLADISGYNFVIDPGVKGKITMKLMNVPWDQSLDIILQTFSLGKSMDGNIIWIAPVTTFAKMADEKAKAKDAEEKSEDIIQKVIRINYAMASEISTAITQGKLLSSRGSITVDGRMNTLIVKDTPTSIEKIKGLVAIMDVSKPQVMIEAKMVEVSSTYSEQLGIKWGGTFAGTGIKSIGQQVSGGFSVNTPVVSAGAGATNPGGVLNLLLGSANTLQVNLSLSALEDVGKSRKLSNPKILTIDNESATIQQGTAIPVQTVSAEGTKTEYVNATLKLTVTPKITPDGYVQLKINATNDSLGILTPQGYAIEKKEVTTQALVKNGETLVLGGIYTTSTVESEEGIPLLGRIPILGWLFKTKTAAGPNITELLIFITPNIVSKQ